MKLGSLFSGYGGLDMGISQVIDARPVWFSEIEKAPSQILAHHWPDVPNLGDITAIDWGDVEPVDILTGGFPCQDVSHAGRRAGLIRDGEGKTRSGLWGEMLRAIVELKPALVIAENVRGLLSAKADSDLEPCTWCMGDGDAVDMRALGAVLADLADAGYDACWTGLRAADIGAPHNRLRVFIAAWPRGSTFRYAGHGTGSAKHGFEPESATSGVGAPGARFAAHTAFDGWEQGRAEPTRLERRPDAPLGSNEDGAVTLLPTPSVADVEGGRKARSGDRSNELLLNGIAAEQRFGDYGPAVTRWHSVINRPAPA